MTIRKELNSLSPDAIVTLFEFNTLPIVQTPTGNDSYYYTNQPVGTDGHILWEGNQYTHMPFSFSSIDRLGDGSALVRPTLEVSDINKTFYAAFLLLGNLSGVEVKRTKTCFKFTDLGSQPDTTQVSSVNSFVIVKSLKEDRNSVIYELATGLDQPNLKIPRRLILRDKTQNNVYAPGVSRVRFRG